MQPIWITSLCIALTLCIVSTDAQSTQSKINKAKSPYIAASSWPDRIIVTPTENPATSFSITWRTDQTIEAPQAQIVKASADARFDLEAKSQTATTQNVSLSHGESPHGKFRYPANAHLPAVNYHGVTLTDLQPDTLYNYRVSGEPGNWTPWRQIKTAPQQRNSDVEFLYFGDAQNGIYSHWPMILHRAWQHAPKAEFAIYAGDLVNEGASDHQWSNWFSANPFVLSTIPAVLVVGNREYDWQMQANDQKEWALSTLWQDQFTLPPSPTLPLELQETVYMTRYPDLDIFVLNSGALGDVALLDAQAQWLDAKLQNSSAKWHIVTMHHPVFSSCGMPLNTAGQDEPDVRAAFLPVFLKHNVDLVLQGHDHTYSRGSIGTPEDIGKVASPIEPKKVKSVFLTTVASPKTYPQKPNRWQQYNHYGVVLERIGENTPTYQIIRKTGNQLRYQSFTTDGKLYDGFVLEKNIKGQNTLKIQADLPAQRTFANTGPYKSHHDLAE
jgi:3',5'-cyclic AMP phosphodiesterase CpdA